jgi:hypothetical protein
MDLLRWFVESLEPIRDLRRDLPHWSGPAQKTAFLDSLKQRVMEAWTPDMIDQFFAEKDARALPRSYFALPETASSSGIHLRANQPLHLVAPRVLEFLHDKQAGSVRFKTGGREWQCSDVLLPLLNMLNQDGGSYTKEELLSAAPDSSQIPMIEECLGKWISQGLLAISPVHAGLEWAPKAAPDDANAGWCRAGLLLTAASTNCNVPESKNSGDNR